MGKILEWKEINRDTVHVGDTVSRWRSGKVVKENATVTSLGRTMKLDENQHMLGNFELEKLEIIDCPHGPKIDVSDTQSFSSFLNSL